MKAAVSRVSRSTIAIRQSVSSILLWDFVSYLIIVAVILWIEIFAEPFKRGFFCRDQTIMLQPKENTISRAFLYGPIMLVTPFIMALCEILVYLKKENFRLGGLFFHIYKTAGVYFFGMGCLLLIVFVTKYTTGRLAPNFFMSCRPQVYCNVGNAYKFLKEYNCKYGINEDLVKQSRISFPSAHSAVAAMSFGFLALYIEATLTWRHSFFFKRVLQLLCVILALTVGYTRFVDNARHTSDIIIGLSAGAIAAFVSAVFLSHFFDADLFAEKSTISLRK